MVRAARGLRPRARPRPGACARSSSTTPEELDRDVRRASSTRARAGLAIEPRWTRRGVARAALRARARAAGGRRGARALGRRLVHAWPGAPGRRAQRSTPRRRCGCVAARPSCAPRARSSCAARSRSRAGDRDGGAQASGRRGFERGGEDYRARMALGRLLLERGRARGGAEQHFRPPSATSPASTSRELSAELHAGRSSTTQQERTEDAHGARASAGSAWNAGDYALRVQVAALARRERPPRARGRASVREANEIDPFRRDAAPSTGARALAALGRHEEALREFDVGAGRAARELDAASSAGRAPARSRCAELARPARGGAWPGSGGTEEAAAAARAALELDPDVRRGARRPWKRSRRTLSCANRDGAARTLGRHERREDWRGPPPRPLHRARRHRRLRQEHPGARASCEALGAPRPSARRCTCASRAARRWARACARCCSAPRARTLDAGHRDAAASRPRAAQMLERARGARRWPQGRDVVCERFHPSTFAYQAEAGGLDEGRGARAPRALGRRARARPA